MLHFRGTTDLIRETGILEHDCDLIDLSLELGYAVHEHFVGNPYLIQVVVQSKNLAPD